MPPEVADRMLTLREVAALLTISETHARNLIGKGEFPIPHAKLGDRYRFSPTLVRRYIDGGAA